MLQVLVLRILELRISIPSFLMAALASSYEEGWTLVRSISAVADSCKSLTIVYSSSCWAKL